MNSSEIFAPPPCARTPYDCRDSYLPADFRRGARCGAQATSLRKRTNQNYDIVRGLHTRSSHSINALVITSLDDTYALSLVIYSLWVTLLQYDFFAKATVPQPDLRGSCEGPTLETDDMSTF